jgi:hypothetical protein
MPIESQAVYLLSVIEYILVNTASIIVKWSTGPSITNVFLDSIV